MVKQVLVLRKDLNMRKGKMAAQAAHASMKVFFDRLERTGDGYRFSATPEVREWIDGVFTKVVVGVPSLDDLLAIQAAAEAAGLPTALVVDSGKTEFHGVKTPTTVAIGPAEAERIDAITGHLPLL